MPRKTRILFLMSLFIFGVFAQSSWVGLARAGTQQCDPGIPGICQTLGFAPCYQCDIQTVQCEPDSTLCDDGNDCTADTCNDTPAIGCVYESLVATGATDLPGECYVCEPPENDVDISNGVCNDGENCQNDPSDCGIVGFPCTFPNSPSPPLDAPGFPAIPPGNPIADCLPATVQAGGDLTFPTVACEDGDRCTQNICTIPDGTNPFPPLNQTGTCTNPQITACNPISDGCCPAGCVGPASFGAGCPSTVATPCDPDCCLAQSCGDSLVEAPETCDDLPDGTAGIQPNGQPVTAAQCRDPGTQNECSYCGDGIVDSPVEQCDGTNDAACGGEACSTTCTCNQTNLCLFGGGGLAGEGGPGPACDCSLAKGEVDASRGVALLGMLGIALSLLVWRRRA